MRERMRNLTFEVICRAVFGVTDPARVERLREAFAAAIDMGPILFTPRRPAARVRRPRSLGAAAARGSHGRRALYEEIAERRTEPDLDERTDVLSLLLRARDEDGRAMSDVELRDELVTMLGAGHETTATGLAFAFDLIPRHPEVLRGCARNPGDDDT